MDSAVVRVKRRITDEPFDKFVLNCKKARMCESLGDTIQQKNRSDASQTILKFAATINAEDDITTHLTRLRKPEAEELAKKVRKPPNVLTKLRQQLKDDAKEQRYKVVNFFRSMNEANTSDGADTAHANITVVDVIKEENSKVTTPTTDAEQSGSALLPDTKSSAQVDKFVYDLYFIESFNDEPTEINPNDFISVRPFDDLLYIEPDNLGGSDLDCCSIDSNGEANYQNDYPDTDSDFSVKDDDIRIAVENLAITTEGSSSDDDYAYGNDPKANVIEFMEGETGDEFEYFKRMGRIRKHNPYYRTNARARMLQRAHSDSDSDIDGNMPEEPSSSEASPLMSCNEDD